MILHAAILRSAAMLVPRDQRAEWFAEWSAELCYVTQRRIPFCLGAFQDAFWLRRNKPAPHPCDAYALESPARCLLFLAALAAVSVFFIVRLPVPCKLSVPLCSTMSKAQLILGDLGVILFSLLILPATTSMALGEYPENRHSVRRTQRSRRWIFLAVKIALLLPAICFASFLLDSMTSVVIHADTSLASAIVALRWALIDQRRRCPVCLRLLRNPTIIGNSSHAFLEWYGTELICVEGHGFLYVPEISTSSYTTQRWQYLDPSWSSLFS